MTREIKFRAWDKLGRRFLGQDDWYLHPTKGSCIYWNKMPIKPEDLEIMQYTGLKDKNGKEIYEGDIVRAYTYFDEEAKELNESTVHQIVWGDDYPAFDMKPAPFEEYNSLQQFASIQSDGEQIEVIGNIYENPELMK